MIVALAIVVFLGSILGFVQLGVVVQTNTAVHWRPDYEKIDIMPLLEKAERTEEDYAALYAQTGLTKIGIDDLLAINGISRILDIQERYFKEYAVETKGFAPFTCEQEIDGTAAFAVLQNGDIFVSNSAFTSWFRYGHAALIVEAETNLALDSVSIGKDSAFCSVLTYNDYANFLLLRPKLDESVREEVAAYAKESLVGVPYRLTTGIFSAKFEETLLGSHCGHLVWYAYKKFGLDLDSTGGLIVTPQDLANSPQLELVQTFGFDPATLWK